MISAAEIVAGPHQLLLERNATESAFKAVPLATFRVIHLTVHGVVNTGFPDRAALVLTSSPTSGEDGLLQAREIRPEIHRELSPMVVPVIEHDRPQDCADRQGHRFAFAIYHAPGLGQRGVIHAPENLPRLSELPGTLATRVSLQLQL